MAIEKKSIIRYAVLPGFWPRIKALVASGFAFIASLIAIIYFNVGLLPAGHPYLDARNHGRFGIRHVMADAGRRLEFSRANIDKVLIYFVIMAGLIILVLQFGLLAASFFSAPVFASNWTEFFVNTPIGHRVFTGTGLSPAHDISFVVLENVFGVRSFSGTASALGFFDSCVSNLTVSCTDLDGNAVASPAIYPRPIHIALHQMFAFYSFGIAFLAGVVLLYFIVALVGETITTGTPFGKRMSRAWIIPRIIVFFALIAPITSLGNNAGLNGAQLITLSVAKYGSNMATNAWLRFADTAVTEGVSVTRILGQDKQLIAKPNTPEISALTQFMHVARMCMFAEKIMNGIEVQPYIVREHSDDTNPMSIHAAAGGGTQPYNQAGGTPNDYIDYFAVNFSEALIFSRYNNVVLRFGHRNPPNGDPHDPNDLPGYYDGWGNVEPTCGELQFTPRSTEAFVVNGIQALYFDLIGEYLSNDGIADITTHCMILSTVPYGNNPDCVDQGYTVPGALSVTTDNSWVNSDVARANIEYYNSIIKRALVGEVVDWGTFSRLPGGGWVGTFNGEFETNNTILTPQLRQRGWAGAALWYNQIAELNGIMSASIQNIPRPFKYPRVMEEVAQQRKANDSKALYHERFNPQLKNGKMATLKNRGDQNMAAVLYSAYSFWEGSGVQETISSENSSNAVVSTINMMLGTNGLYDILENNGVHPLAMLSALGKGMVDAALQNLFGGIVGQGIGKLLDNFVGEMASVAASFAFKFGMIGLSVGFVMYYVLPLLPFIYFIFAFSGWIKSIFEAIVAMPLWALAHLKLDGPGLPGPWATNGYFLLLEIFLRPTLIIVGFLAGISIFSALVDGLHGSFNLLMVVATGFDMEAEIHTPGSDLLHGLEALNHYRGPIDEFFYTIVYAIIVYMIGMSCFKLVDQIPNQIIRWMGATVATFQENAGDPASKLMSQMFRGSQLTNAQLTQLIQQSLSKEGGKKNAKGMYDKTTEQTLINSL